LNRNFEKGLAPRSDRRPFSKLLDQRIGEVNIEKEGLTTGRRRFINE
jgi:hypothetical protein